MSGPKMRKSFSPYYLGGLDGTNDFVWAGSYDFLLVSYGHPLVPKGSSRVLQGLYSRRRRKNKGAKLIRHGGPFYQLTKGYEVTGSHWLPTPYGQFPALNYTGRVVPSVSPGSIPSPPVIPLWSEEQALLNSKSPILYKRARPGNPTADVGVTLTEFVREGLPNIPGRLLARLRNMRSVGKEYLNVQFGWAPLVRDIQKMYETYRRLDQHLKQLSRDNGKSIRRRRSLGVQTSSSITTESFTRPYERIFNPPPWAALSTGSSTLSVLTKTEEEYWFVGSFRYYIPDIGSDQWTRRATRALFGANPTPEVLWNVLPWSWLLDWFGNIGDVVSNISPNAADNLTSEYAFTMHRKITKVYTECTGIYTPFASTKVQPGTYSCSTVEITSSKSRIETNPYAASLGWDGLSPYQLSILGALGISRRR